MHSLFCRLLHTLVLTSFLWSTLFPIVAFADQIERLHGDAIQTITQKGFPYAQLNIGIHTFDPHSHDIPTDDEQKAQTSSPFLIPLGHTRKAIQGLIDKLYSDSLYQNLTITEQKELTWTAYGLDFYFQTSGDLIISRSESSTPFATTGLHFSNQHGAIILKNDLQLSHVKLSGKDVIQQDGLTVDTLALDIEGTYTNQGTLAFSTLHLDDTRRPSDASSAQFINEGTLFGRTNARITGSGLLINARSGTFAATHTLGLSHAQVINRGLSSIAHVFFDDSPSSSPTPLSQKEAHKTPHFINEGHYVPTTTASICGHGTFINTQTGTFNPQQSMTLSSHTFTNHGLFHAAQALTLALTHAFSNTGTMLLDDTLSLSGAFQFDNHHTWSALAKSTNQRLNDRQILAGIQVTGTTTFDHFTGHVRNKGIWKTKQTLHGHLARLSNEGTFETEGGFNDLIIDRLINQTRGDLIGNGRLILGRGSNTGRMKATHLRLTIRDRFTHKHLTQTGEDRSLLAIDTLETLGQGTFYQQGLFQGTRLHIDNAHFDSQHSLHSPELALSFGRHLLTFLNHEDVTLYTRSLTFEASLSSAAKANQ